VICWPLRLNATSSTPNRSKPACADMSMSADPAGSTLDEAIFLVDAGAVAPDRQCKPGPLDQLIEGLRLALEQQDVAFEQRPVAARRQAPEPLANDRRDDHLALAQGLERADRSPDKRRVRL
jgi:hypothetical protein